MKASSGSVDSSLYKSWSPGVGWICICLLSTSYTIWLKSYFTCRSTPTNSMSLQSLHRICRSSSKIWFWSDCLIPTKIKNIMSPYYLLILLQSRPYYSIGGGGQGRGQAPSLPLPIHWFHKYSNRKINLERTATYIGKLKIDKIDTTPNLHSKGSLTRFWRFAKWVLSLNPFPPFLLNFAFYYAIDLE